MVVEGFRYHSRIAATVRLRGKERWIDSPSGGWRSAELLAAFNAPPCTFEGGLGRTGRGIPLFTGAILVGRLASGAIHVGNIR